MAYYNSGHVCGLYYTDLVPQGPGSHLQTRKYLPQVSLTAYGRILSTVSRTVLTQTFTNPSSSATVPELRYTFPLYDGVSVVDFTCTVNQDRVIRGVVKEKQRARQAYDSAVSRGQTAGLLEQLPSASDVFTTTIGNVPGGATVRVEMTLLGELKHDAGIDGIRFTIPTTVCPRYGDYPGELVQSPTNVYEKAGIEITVDVEMPDGGALKTIQSPSHPIAVTVGSTSRSTQPAQPSLQFGSASLSLGTAELDKDFVLEVLPNEIPHPVAILETHPTIPSQRALLATLVPRFNLASSRPEIVFICDRSGSMGDSKIDNLRSVLQLFLKSLPVGVKFNICSFGTAYSFLFPEGSMPYDQTTLDEAVRHVQGFTADMGGTEIIGPVEAVFKKRYTDMNLEVFVLTDGDIWNQQGLFDVVNREVQASDGAIRLFSLGIGRSVSHSLVEGLARAGCGFAQTVGENEKMDRKVMRMLKSALTPHVSNYTISVKYAKGEVSCLEGDDGFDLVDHMIAAEAASGSRADMTETQIREQEDVQKDPICLFDPAADPDDGLGSAILDCSAGIPSVSPPKVLQTPFQIPPLFPFNRTNIYLLLSSQTEGVPQSIVLHGTQPRLGQLELEIPISTHTTGETIHQLAARKAVLELEEGRGWLHNDSLGLKKKYPGHFPELIQREAVRLGVQFQVGGKWCSFVAVETNSGDDDMSLAQKADAQESREMQRPVAPEPNTGFSGMGTSSFAVQSVAHSATRSLAHSVNASFYASMDADFSMDAEGSTRYSLSNRYQRNHMDAGLGMQESEADVLVFDQEVESIQRCGLSPTSESSFLDLSSDPGAISPIRSSPLHDVILLQTFVGSWALDPEFLGAVGLDKSPLDDLGLESNARFAEAIGFAGLSSNLDGVATVLALAFLRLKGSTEQDIWDLVADKAMAWLKGQVTQYGDGLGRVEKAIEAAEGLF